MITVEKVEDVPALIESDRNKYVFTEKTLKICEHTLHQIQAVCDFGNVKEGQIGGYVESYENLSQSGNAWVDCDARVFCDSVVLGNAYVSGCSYVYGNACIMGYAEVYNSKICGNVCITDYAHVHDTTIRGCENIVGSAAIFGKRDYACVKGFGTAFRNTTFFRCFDGIVRVRCGCFYGTIPEFREQVKRTRNGKIAKEYLMIADLMEHHFLVGNENED